MNNKEKFLALVDAGKSENVSQTSLDMAKVFYLEENLLDRRGPLQCARGCIILARRIDILRAGDRSSQSAESLFQRLPLTPQDLMMSDDFAEKIRPAVKQVRDTLFASSHPPFATYEDAVQWLEQTAAQEAQARAKNQANEALKQTIVEMEERYEPPPGEPLAFHFDLLEYVKPADDWVRRMPVWEGTSLATLAGVVRKLADATGFTQASVVAYVLAGIRPLLASVSIDMSDGSSNEFHIFRRSATVTLRSPYVTDSQLRKIRKVIRREWHTERKKPLTEGNEQLLAIVQRHGGVPKDKGHGEHKTFFEQVRQEYNLWVVEHRCKPHKDWRVTRNAYERLRKKTRQGAPCVQEALC
jgi:hypothetical protein